MKKEHLILHLITDIDVSDINKSASERLKILTHKVNLFDESAHSVIQLPDWETAVILSDTNRKDYADYHTILTAKYIVTYNPNAHIIAEIKDSKNIPLLGHTKVADVICVEELCEKLLVNTLITNGLSKFFKHFLHNGIKTNSIFTMSIPSTLVGESFRYAERLLCDYQQDMILIGYITKTNDLNGKPRDYIVINPEKSKPESPQGKEYILKQDDRLVIIGYDNPDLSRIENQDFTLRVA